MWTWDSETLEPDRRKDGTPLSMDQFRNMFGCVRIPHPSRDFFERYPNSRHVRARGFLDSLIWWLMLMYLSCAPSLPPLSLFLSLLASVPLEYVPFFLLLLFFRKVCDNVSLLQSSLFFVNIFDMTLFCVLLRWSVCIPMSVPFPNLVRFLWPCTPLPFSTTDCGALPQPLLLCGCSVGGRRIPPDHSPSTGPGAYCCIRPHCWAWYWSPHCRGADPLGGGEDLVCVLQCALRQS